MFCFVCCRRDMRGVVFQERLASHNHRLRRCGTHDHLKRMVSHVRRASSAPPLPLNYELMFTLVSACSAGAPLDTVICCMSFYIIFIETSRLKSVREKHSVDRRYGDG